MIHTCRYCSGSGIDKDRSAEDKRDRIFLCPVCGGHGYRSEADRDAATLRVEAHANRAARPEPGGSAP